MDMGWLNDFAAQLKALIGPAFASWVGWLARHAEGVIGGKPMPWRALLFEPPVVMLMAILAGGAGRALDLPEHATWALAGVASYYGPQPVLAFVRKLLERKFG